MKLADLRSGKHRPNSRGFPPPHSPSSADGDVYLGYGAYRAEDFDRAAYAALSEDEQQAQYQATVERLMDERVFPVLRKHGLQPEWNRSQHTRILVTGARWYASLA